MAYKTNQRYTRMGEEFVVLSREGALELITTLTAQLANRAAKGRQLGGCATLVLWNEEESIAQRVTFTLRPDDHEDPNQ